MQRQKDYFNGGWHGNNSLPLVDFGRGPPVDRASKGSDSEVGRSQSGKPILGGSENCNPLLDPGPAKFLINRDNRLLSLEAIISLDSNSKARPRSQPQKADAESEFSQSNFYSKFGKPEGIGSVHQRKKGDVEVGDAQNSKKVAEGESCDSFEGLSISSEELLDGDPNSEAEEGVDVIDCNDGSIAALLEDWGATTDTIETNKATIIYFPVPNPAGETDLREKIKGGVGVSNFKSKDDSVAPSVPITNEISLAEEGVGVIVSDVNSEQSLVLKHFRKKKKKKRAWAKVSGK
ncbi:hypothetical protein Pyn_25230 [Prunus yedoensis var. nudiflora]|uniref:Uncharacterized protein n=1 Tax=Prunus yedoensis var. nudiflora TaxID=2094558 RepID=A0A314XU24_PRUYE|nr:hypothetical protein Pyn_25230 [Prunus yedoensis var. nudiflora]